MELCPWNSKKHPSDQSWITCVSYFFALWTNLNKPSLFLSSLLTPDPRLLYSISTKYCRLLFPKSIWVHPLCPISTAAGLPLAPRAPGVAPLGARPSTQSARPGPGPLCRPLPSVTWRPSPGLHLHSRLLGSRDPQQSLLQMWPLFTPLHSQASPLFLCSLTTHTLMEMSHWNLRYIRETKLLNFLS